MPTRALVLTALACLAALLFVGCGGRDADVVLYTSVDQPVAQPIIDRFEAETGLTVRVVTDAEASKSVGLAERVRAEARHPRADVWWGNEPFLTVRLAEEGLLAEYRSPSAADVPERYKDAGGRWASVGLRARVLAVSQRDDAPAGGAAALRAAGAANGIAALLSPDLKGRIVMARPNAGTTAGHVAALYVAWGDERADRFFRDLRANGVTLVGGNGPAAQQVAAGNFDLGLTDNDDVANAAAMPGRRNAVLEVFPDQERGDLGTLTLPTTVGLIAGRPERAAARRLVDHLLSAEVDRALYDARFAVTTVRELSGTDALRPMDVDYAAVAAKLPDAIRRATAILDGRE